MQTQYGPGNRDGIVVLDANTVVAKVNQLTPLCDHLEVKREEYFSIGGRSVGVVDVYLVVRKDKLLL